MDLTQNFIYLGSLPDVKTWCWLPTNGCSGKGPAVTGFVSNKPYSTLLSQVKLAMKIAQHSTPLRVVRPYNCWRLTNKLSLLYRKQAFRRNAAQDIFLHLFHTNLLRRRILRRGRKAFVRRLRNI